MMNFVVPAFCVICFLLAFLAGFILFFLNKEQVFSNRLLAVLLFFFGLQSFFAFAFYSGLLFKMPHIYRAFGPTTFLIFPVSYFYVRSVLSGEYNFKKYDWIVLIPSILYAINLFPVYSLPYEKKLALVTQFTINPKMQGQYNDGYLPPYVFSFIRTSWSAVFLILQFRLIRQFRKKVNNQIIEINKVLLQWLTLFTTLLFFVFSVFALFTILAPIFEISPKFTDLGLQLIVLIITFKLFTKPHILYGIHIPSQNFISISTSNSTVKVENKSEDKLVKNHTLSKSVQTNLKYIEIINSHFKINLPFLNPDYNLNNLVDEVQIPRHLLSTFINQEYGIGFRKFLNQKRIEYILENFNKAEWKNLTLEAIANESGFKNRSTFINNFKEVTGKNPLEYFKNNSL